MPGLVARRVGVVSIPQSEFCAFERRNRRLELAEFSKVSIPQSEFCAFEHVTLESDQCHCRRFQFPNRNSVRLNWVDIKQLSFDINSFNSPIGILCV